MSCLLSYTVSLITFCDTSLICSTFISIVNIIFNCHDQINFMRPLKWYQIYENFLTKITHFLFNQQIHLLTNLVKAELPKKM